MRAALNCLEDFAAGFNHFPVKRIAVAFYASEEFVDIANS
jgi:hypothetical protein